MAQYDTFWKHIAEAGPGALRLSFATINAILVTLFSGQSRLDASAASPDRASH